MHLLEVMCYADQLAHSFSLGDLICFVSKNSMKAGIGGSLAWKQAISLLTAVEHDFVWVFFFFGL